MIFYVSDAQLNIKKTLYFEKSHGTNIKQEKFFIFYRDYIVRKYEFIKRNTKTTVKRTVK